MGYSSKHDEWRPRNDLVTIAPGTEPSLSTEEYNFNKELAMKLKSSLLSQSNPAVKIEMWFDKTVFDEGLKVLGQLKIVKEELTFGKLVGITMALMN